MPINLPDLKPLNLNQFNNGLSIGDGLGDTLPILLNKLNNNFNLINNNSREKLTSNRTYYVAIDGLSTNTGLTQTAPLSTLNQVVDIIYNNLDLNGYEIIINIQQGLYTNTVIFDGLPLGARTEFPITIVGNPTNETLVKFSYAANINNCCFLIKNKAKVDFRYISFENALTTTDTCAIKVIDSQIKTSNITYESFGASCDHILLQKGGVLFYGTHTIKGTNRYHLNVQHSTVLKNSTSCVWLFQSSTLTALVNSLDYSTVILNNNETTPNLGYSGNSAGSLFYRDFTSTVLFNSNPLGLTADVVNNVAIASTLTAKDINVSNTLTVTNNATFNKDLIVSLNSSIGGNCAITGGLTINGVTNTNTLNVNANFTMAPATIATFNGSIKVVNNSEFQRATFKDEVLLEKKVIFNQDLIALGAVNIPNGVITKSNLSASGGTGTSGILNDILVSDPTVNGGMKWSPRLTNLENNYTTKANLASPDFTGVPTAPTPARTSNTTQVANTAYVNDLVTFTANQILGWMIERVPDKLITAWSGNIEDIKEPWFLCITGDSMVKLADGRSMRIDEIVNNRLDVEVLSFNEVTGKIEPKRVIDWFSNPVEDKSIWLSIQTYKTCKPSNVKTLTLTKDHPMWVVNKGWVKGSDLKVGDTVLKYVSKFSTVCKQALAGMYMGDASFDKTSKALRLVHGDKQKGYITDTASKLNINIHNGVSTAGYDKEFKYCSTKVSIKQRGDDIYNLFDQPQISLELIKYLTPVGLAYWYMDDGNLQTDRRNGTQCAQLHTESYSEIELNVIKEGLFLYYGLEVSQYKRNNTAGKLTRLTLKSSDKFLSMIAPYIHPDLRYKLPEKYKNVSYVIPDYTFIEEELSEEKLISVKPTNCKGKAIYNTRYDITVEDNHSFIANGFVSKNCDGTNGTPDLRERFIMGAGKQTGTAYCINEVNVPQTTKTIAARTLNVTSSQVDINLNTSTVSLTKDQIPAHNHFSNYTMVYYGGNALPISTGGGGGKGGSSSTVVAFLSPVNETSVGLNQGHNHNVFGRSEAHTHSVTIPASTVDVLPPYYVLAYITLKPKTYTFTITN